MAWGNKNTNDTVKTQESESGSSINLIGTGTTIVGEISSNGDIRIDGTLEGNIETRGKLVIGQSGLVKGNIKCKNSDISGTVQGKLYVDEFLSLKSTARITGELFVNKLAIEPGALFTGTCNMSDKRNANETPAVNKEKVEIKAKFN